MEKKVLNFQLDKKDIKIKELLNGEFLELQMDAISDIYPNRNDSHFTLACLQDLMPTVYNKPILGAFDITKGVMGDFKGHECPNGLRYDPELSNYYYDYTAEGSEIPLGMVRESDTVEIVHNNKTNLNWLRFTCVIWTQYNYKAVKSLLKARKGNSKVSVEVEVLESHVDDNGIEIFDKCNMLGITILGQDTLEGVPDAHLDVLAILDNALFQKKQKALKYAYSALENYNSNVETSNEGDNQEVPTQKDSNNEATFSSDADGIENENPEEETIMTNQESQEGGNNEMNLTMNEKRELFEAYLREHFPMENVSWIYVADFSDTDVFVEIYDEQDISTYYRIPYTITADDEGKPVVSMDFDQKVQVVRSWKEFTADDTCPECGNDPCTCSADGTATETANFEQDNAPVNTNTEPTTPAGEGMSTTEQIEAATSSIAAPATQTSAENVGEANSEAASTLNGSVPEGENPAGVPEVQQEVVNEDGIGAVTAPKGPDGETAQVAQEPDNAATIIQPNDEDKEKLFATNNGENANPENGENTSTETATMSAEDKVLAETVSTEATFASETVEINGEKYDVNKLFEKYNADMDTFASLKEEMETLKANYTSLQENVKVQEAKKLADFGVNFINSEKEVDDESKADFAKQVFEKCESYEFTTEDEVKKFAKSLLAMYFYEKREQSAGDDVVMPLNQVAVPQTVNALEASNQRMDDAFAALNKI